MSIGILGNMLFLSWPRDGGLLCSRLTSSHLFLPVTAHSAVAQLLPPYVDPTSRRQVQYLANVLAGTTQPFYAIRNIRTSRLTKVGGMVASGVGYADTGRSGVKSGVEAIQKETSSECLLLLGSTL
jgi:hypothetical protein